MNYPSLKTGWLFWGTQMLLVPDVVLVLHRGVGSDRIRRLPYADIRRVAATTTVPPVPIMLCALPFFLGVVCMTQWDLPWLGIFLMIPALCGLTLCLTRRCSSITIQTDGGAVRMRKQWLSPRKRGAFLAALMAEVRQAQGVAPLRNGVPMDN